MDKKTTKNILTIILITILFIFTLWNISTIAGLLSDLFIILRPVIIGFALAFVLKGFKNFFKKQFLKLFKKHKTQKLADVLSTVCVYILLIGIITTLILIVIPQLSESIDLFKNNFDGYVDNAQNYIHKIANKYNSDFLSNLDIESKLSDLMNKVYAYVPYIIKGALGFTTSIVGTTTDIIIGVIFSVYFLSGKDKLFAQFKKILVALLNKKKSQKIIGMLEKTNSAFSKYVRGQLTEAVILGTLCFIGMTVFRFEYALLISVLVGVTSLIPIVGAFVGTIPGVFILWLIEPSKAFWFIIFILVLQQIEGNLIYPRVVGTNVGLPALWVLFAITVGGGLYGILGMIISVPLMSLIYDAVKDKVNKKIKEQKVTETKKVT